VMAPTGQYDPTKLIKWGTNHWSFKPEFGYSQPWGGKWVLDAYFGAWFFITNSDFWSRHIYFAGTRSQSQSPIGSLEGHLSYNLKSRLWTSLDGNFWFGGKTSVNGVQNPLSQETNSRLGGTVAVPITKHQPQAIAPTFGLGATTRTSRLHGSIPGWGNPIRVAPSLSSVFAGPIFPTSRPCQ
jgi:hypothetical protein